MSDNAPISPGTGLGVATDEVLTALTGTVAKNGTTTITGTSTLFTTQLSVGQQISVPGGGGTEVRTVSAIASDTSLTVSVAFANTASSQTASAVLHYQRVKLDLGGDGLASAAVDVIPIVGKTIVVSSSVTRPADTTTYAAGDAVTNSTSAPVIITFTNCARANGGSGHIVNAALVDSANVATKGIFELWMFDTTATPDNDNAVFTPTDAECETLLAVIPFPVAYVGDATTGAGGNCMFPSLPLDIPFVCGGASRDLFGLLVVRNAYPPVSAEKFTARLWIVQH